MLRQTIDELIAESHATGYGSELPPSVTRLVQALADGIDAKAAPAAPVQPAAPDPAIAALETEVAALKAQAAAFAGAKAEVDQLVRVLSGLAPAQPAAPAA